MVNRLPQRPDSLAQNGIERKQKSEKRIEILRFFTKADILSVVRLVFFSDYTERRETNKFHFRLEA